MRQLINRRKRQARQFAHVLMIFAVILPLLCALVLPLKSIHAEPLTPADEVLLDNDAIKVTVHHEAQGENVAWTIGYVKKESSIARVPQFKLVENNVQLKFNQLGLRDRWQFTSSGPDKWLQLKTFTTDEVAGSVEFILPVDAEPDLYVQVAEGQNKNQTQSILTEEESGPYRLNAVVEEVSTASSEEAVISSEIPVSTSEETTSSTEEVDTATIPTLSSQEPDTAKVPVTSTLPSSTISSTEQVPVRSETETSIQQKAPVKTVQKAMSDFNSASGYHVYQTSIATRSQDDLNSATGKSDGKTIDINTVPDGYKTSAGEFSYFISQAMIDTSDGKTSLPQNISITDTLPAGVELVDGANSISLYNLDEVAKADKAGKPSLQTKFNEENLIFDAIPNAFSSASVLTGQNLKLVFSDSAMAAINALSEQDDFKGKDVVIQLKVKGTEAAFTDATKTETTVENTASSIFSYDADKSFTAQSNTTQVVLTHAPLETLRFIKYQTDTTTPVKGAEFAIYASEADFKNGEQPLTENQISAEDGTFNFSIKKSSRYYVHEVKAPDGYTVGEDETIDLAHTSQLNKTADGKIIIYNDLQKPNPATAKYNLIIYKKDTDGNGLHGAKIAYVAGNGEENSGTSETDNNKNGLVEGFTDKPELKLDAGNSYEISEKEPPAGYQKLASDFKLNISETGEATLTYQGNDSTANNPTSNKVTTTYNEKTREYDLTMTIYNEKQVITVLPNTGVKGASDKIVPAICLIAMSAAYLVFRILKKVEL